MCGIDQFSITCCQTQLAITNLTIKFLIKNMHQIMIILIHSRSGTANEKKVYSDDCPS